MADPILCACGCGQPTKFNHGQQRKYVKGHYIRVPGQHPKQARPLAERIMESIAIDPESGCWIWQRRTISSGYGQIKAGGSSRLAHRVSYETFVGPIPDGLSLDHLCHTRDETCSGGANCPHRRCINPDHLEPVTAKVNAARSRLDAQANFAEILDRRRLATHCANGHPWDEENTRIAVQEGKPVRVCRVCGREATRRHRAKRSTE